MTILRTSIVPLSATRPYTEWSTTDQSLDRWHEPREGLAQFRSMVWIGLQTRHDVQEVSASSFWSELSMLFQGKTHVSYYPCQMGCDGTITRNLDRLQICVLWRERKRLSNVYHCSIAWLLLVSFGFRPVSYHSFTSFYALLSLQ
jgi:hypothetical protein